MTEGEFTPARPGFQFNACKAAIAGIRNQSYGTAATRRNAVMIPLMMATAAFGDWLEKLRNHVNSPASDATTLPPMDPTQCRFGQWYQGSGKLQYGDAAEFQALGTLHEQIHALTTQLVAAHHHENSAEVAQFMKELQAQENALFDAVTGLIVSRLF
jgi:hypothetical protein